MMYQFSAEQTQAIVDLLDEQPTWDAAVIKQAVSTAVPDFDATAAEWQEEYSPDSRDYNAMWLPDSLTILASFAPSGDPAEGLMWTASPGGGDGRIFAAGAEPA